MTDNCFYCSDSDSGLYCQAVHLPSNYLCTRTKDHKGWHVACDTRTHMIKQWEEETKDLKITLKLTLDELDLLERCLRYEITRCHGIDEYVVRERALLVKMERKRVKLAQKGNL